MLSCLLFSLIPALLHPHESLRPFLFCVPSGVARNKRLQQQLQQQLQQRGDRRLQQREFEALKKRLRRLVERRPLVMGPATEGPPGGLILPTEQPQPQPQQQQQQQHEDEKEDDDFIRECLAGLIRRFSFDAYLAFRCPLSSFAFFCFNAETEGPLLLPHDLLSVAAGPAAAPSAATGETHQGGGPPGALPMCKRFQLLLPGGPQPPALHQNSRNTGAPMQLLPFFWCYCDACSISLSSESNSSSNNNSSSRRGRGIDELAIPAPPLCNDNAAMIAWTAIQYLQAHRGAPWGPPLGALHGRFMEEREAAEEGEEQASTGREDEEEGPLEDTPTGGPPSFPVPFVKPKWDGGRALPRPLQAMDLLLFHALLQHSIEALKREKKGPQGIIP